MTDAFYNSRPWMNLSRAVKKKAIIERRKCPLCQLPVVPGQLLIADHHIPRRVRPDLELDERNLKVLHHACHSKKTRWIDYNDKPPLDADGYPKDWR